MVFTVQLFTTCINKCNLLQLALVTGNIPKICNTSMAFYTYNKTEIFSFHCRQDNVNINKYLEGYGYKNE